MNDLISRKAAIDLWDKYHPYISIEAMEYDRELRALPSASQNGRKGRWILSDEQRQEDVDNGNYRFICSECGKSDIHSKAVTVSFCWNCGCAMEGEEDDAEEIH